MRKRYLVLFSIIALAAGVWFLWLDYSFSVFGEHGFGHTKILEMIKVLHVAIVLLVLGVAGLVRAVFKKIKAG